MRPFNWKRLSCIGAIATRHNGDNCRLFLSVIAGNVNAESVKRFLLNIRRHIHGRVLLVWDGLPAHRGRETTNFLEQHKHWLTPYRLPAYAPELNPVEYLWANLSSRELANFPADNLGILRCQILKGARRIRTHSRLLHSFLNASTLFFDHSVTVLRETQ